MEAIHAPPLIMVPNFLPGIAGAFVPEHVFMTWIVMVFLIVVSYLATRRLTDVPGPIQNVMETVLEAFTGILDSIIGHEGRRYLPLIGSAGLLIFFSNILILIPGLRCPTANLNTTAACALVVFGALLVAYDVALRLVGRGGIAALAAIVLLGGVAFAVGWLSNVNHISIQRFYRDRLMEAFMAHWRAVSQDLTGPAHDGADRMRLHEVGDCGPYPIINTNVILVNAKERRQRLRGAVARTCKRKARERHDLLGHFDRAALDGHRGGHTGDFRERIRMERRLVGPGYRVDVVGVITDIHNLAVLDHRVDFSQRPDVRQRIAVDDDNVGDFPCLDCPQLVPFADEFRRAFRGPDDDISGRETGIDQKLDRAGVFVACCSADRQRRLADPGSQAGVEVGRGRDFDHLLVPPLHRAVALVKMEEVAVQIAQQLHLDVPRAADEFLDEHFSRAERRGRFALRLLQTCC